MKKISLFVYFFIGFVVLGFAAEAEMTVPVNLQYDYNEYIKTEKEKAIKNISQGAYSIEYTDWFGGVRCKDASKRNPGRVVRQRTSSETVYCLDGNLIYKVKNNEENRDSDNLCYASIWEQAVDKTELYQDALAYAKHMTKMRTRWAIGLVLLLITIIIINIIMVKVVKKTHRNEVIFFISPLDAYLSTLGGFFSFFVLIALSFFFFQSNTKLTQSNLIWLSIGVWLWIMIGYNYYKVNKANPNLTYGNQYAITLSRCILTIAIPMVFLFSMKGVTKTKEDTEGSYMLKEAAALAITTALFYGIHKFLMSLVADYDLLDRHIDKTDFQVKMGKYSKMAIEAKDKIMEEQQEFKKRELR